MNRVLVFSALGAATAAVGFSITAYRYEPTIGEGVAVGPVPLSGLSPDEASAKLRTWWEGFLREDVEVTVRNGRLPARRFRVADFGVSLDLGATLSQLPQDGFWRRASLALGIVRAERREFHPVLAPSGPPPNALVDYVGQTLGGKRPARVRYVSGRVVREPEVSGYEVDQAALANMVEQAILGDRKVAVPLVEAPKRVPDGELEKIVGVVSEFGTRFPVNQPSRNANLRIASSKLDGIVLLPGEEFSFNRVVGERTIREGYRLAGIYRNGKHDLGIGGGICQVSGTLYNAVLLANLRVTRRSNHSMPVPYLPIGRDATVDYHGADFRFKNDTLGPIAISSEFAPGKLTFRILGMPDPTMKVKIVTSAGKTWSRGVEYVDDPTLKPGQEKVIEKGSPGHSVTVHRVVYRNGVEVARETLGRSYYGGGVKIIARGPKVAEAKPAAISDPFAPLPPP